MSLTIVSVSLRRVIGLSQWFIMLCLTTVSVSLRRVIGPSQWFITPCLWLLYQYLQEEWYVYHSDLSCHVSDYCISISKKSDTSITVIYHARSLDYCISISKKSDMSITVIYHAMSDYCISITKKSDRSITVNYHAMSDYCISITKKSDRSINDLSCYDWLLYQYHQEEW
jgi:hypothetical protein